MPGQRAAVRPYGATPCLSSLLQPGTSALADSGSCAHIPATQHSALRSLLSHPGTPAGCARRHRGQCAAPTRGACSMCLSPRTRRRLSARTASLRSGEDAHMGSSFAGHAGVSPKHGHAWDAGTALKCAGLQGCCRGVRLSCLGSLAVGRLCAALEHT